MKRLVVTAGFALVMGLGAPVASAAPGLPLTPIDVNPGGPPRVDFGSGAPVFDLGSGEAGTGIDLGSGEVGIPSGSAGSGSGGSGSASGSGTGSARPGSAG
ncbi:hypothetical protein SAMN04244553_2010 [Nocardia amikacinitolerans]|uniref:Uncharacterized protein n=1 Tax=Nocardia amikacinitolerans TaxID=756689 RepID=A0A285L6C5_9NOCA|nr:hypothetical protein [Nocardia amikacinitolerans]SNY80442.1 hypothetical protein SAMN04244553_2010 [Nocardia amikacinitolerans]